ncbi:MAG: hypothetical protein KAR39_04885 [Thermoplasmata archaeon]|nr:hypothetical protein [Thermoplasmata archaeon]
MGSRSKKKGRRAISPGIRIKEVGEFGGTGPNGFGPESRNLESLRGLIQRLEMYEETRITRQGSEEECFVLALRKWLDGDDRAIDEWLSIL